MELNNTQKLQIAMAIIIQILVLSIAVNIWQYNTGGRQDKLIEKQNTFINKLLKKL